MFTTKSIYSRKVHVHNSHYDFSMVSSFDPYIIMVIARRGIGKTFSRVKKCLKEFYRKGEQFIYLTHTQEEIKELAVANGSKFFSSIILELEAHPSKSNIDFLNFLNGRKVEEKKFETNNKNKYSKIVGQVIYINGKIAGFMLSLNSFEKIKKNNFDKVRYFIADEILSEVLTMKNYNDAYRLVNIIQSVARTRDIKLYFLCNSTNIKHPILEKLGLQNMKKREIRIIYSDSFKKPFLVCHYVDNEEYPKFTSIADNSVAGQLAKLLGEDKLEENRFDELDEEFLIPNFKKPSKELFNIKCYNEVYIHIRRAKDGLYYVLSDLGNRKRYLTLDKKLVDTKTIYYKELKDLLLNLYASNVLRYDSFLTKSKLETALNLRKD